MNEPDAVPSAPAPSMAYAIVEPDGAIRQVYGPLGVNEAMTILRGAFSAHAGPPDMGIAILAGPQMGPRNEVVAKLLPDEPILGRVIVTGLPDAKGDLTSLDVRDEDSLRRIAEK